MKVPKQFYKVVRKVVRKEATNEFWSALYSIHPLRNLRYVPGKWTIPNLTENQFLYIFDSRKFARFFKKERMSYDPFRFENYVIFKCLAFNPSQKRMGKHGDYLAAYKGCPPGTWFADQVMITEQVS